jgi:hypothetical protein
MGKSNNSFFIQNDGAVKVCGYNAYYELGLGDTTNRNTSTLITGLSNVKQVTCGGDHTIFLLNDGTVKVCGMNSSYQLGLGDATTRNIPTLISSLSCTLLQDIMNIVIKYLIKDLNNYYTLLTSYYDSVIAHKYTPLTLSGGSSPSTDDFINFGFDSPSSITTSTTIGSDTFIPDNKFNLGYKVYMYDSANITLYSTKTGKLFLIQDGSNIDSSDGTNIIVSNSIPYTTTKFTSRNVRSI